MRFKHKNGSYLRIVKRRPYPAYAETHRQNMKRIREKLISAWRIAYVTKIRPHMRLKTVVYDSILWVQMRKLSVNFRISGHFTIWNVDISFQYADFFEWASSFRHYAEYPHMRPQLRGWIICGQKKSNIFCIFELLSVAFMRDISDRPISALCVENLNV